MIVLTLLTAILSGFVGSSVDTSLLVYSDTGVNITVQNQTHTLTPGMNSIIVPFSVERGTNEYEVIVTTDQLSYTLPVTIIGKRKYNWLWSLLVIPVIIGVYGAVRFRRIRAGSS